MGRVTVQSALGEPLRVQIDIPDINADEVASLRVNVASPDAFRAAGVEYNPALSNATITLQRRPDGRYFLQLTSERSINDPFVDLILETTWASGRIVRDYTMLFDPPNLRQPQAPIAAQVSPPPASQQAQPAAQAQRPAAAEPPAARAPAGRAPTTTARAARTPTPSAAAPTPAAPGGDGKQVTVQNGDTAGKIAAANKPATVSLDQMLLALLRSNPDAFAGGNVNRLRSGAVLQIPSAEQATQVNAGEAGQQIVVQSRDFNEFRRRLAEGLPTSNLGSSDRKASGKVQAQVDEKKPTAGTPDKLTLSKNAVQGKAAEEKIARDRAAKDAATRVAELNKNLSDLNRLNGTTGSGSTGSGTGAAAGKPGVSVPVATAGSTAASAAKPPVAAGASAPKPQAAAPVTASPAPAAAPTASAASPMANVAATPASAPAAPAATGASAVPAMASASAPDSTAGLPATGASAAALPASAPAAAASTTVATATPKPAAKPPSEPSLVDDLLENPLIPAAGVGLLALLLGAGFYKLRQRRKATQIDSSFLESRLQPDSFFGASGGQRIDTAEAMSSASGSSMVYSPSQLDAAGDVDPVAEADVYLAYGRDLQAEEILKEALRTNPQRVAIHAKLLEIYAKRRDGKAFQSVAVEAYNLTNGQGLEWEHICELGRELDPGNTLYRPGGEPDAGVAAASAATSPVNFGSTTAISPPPAEAQHSIPPDIDLDFSLDEQAPAPHHAAAPLEATQKFEPIPSLDMDFNAPAAPGHAAHAPVDTGRPSELPDLALDDNSLDFDMDPAPAPAPAAAARKADDGMMEFDLGALSLDLPSSTQQPSSSALSAADESISTGGLELDSGDGNPLATKLALAEEFNAIGDPDGARSLAQEVVAEASGELKTRAQRLLAEIG
ncbi:MAG: FimV/HubP family polar landmark protein [Pseudomonadota bacterium]